MLTQPKLHIILASTRPGRAGLPIARWFQAEAEVHAAFDVELVDLLEWNLPFMDEPHHPRLRQYTKDHTKAWSAKMDSADAFVIVTPEYNHGYTAPLKNAIDYLIHEWANKPVGFVSYGGLSGGTRAVQQLKPILVDLKMTSIPEGVYIPFVHRSIHDGVFVPPDGISRTAQLLLTELAGAERILRPLRASTRAVASS